ncbi:MAG: protein-glutamate O-methyltransferase CheR [Hyphomicrobiales bacterium]|nr:protein-glutamate O-methyltransferase CheR [Hyphomicrobiales bacterium]
MTQAFDELARFLSEQIGHAIDPRRQAAVESRLAPVMSDCGARNLADLVVRLRTGSDPEVASRVIDAMVTCETLFFRDRHPFDAMRSIVLPALRDARSSKRTLRIWSAACATGQEPYSIAMLLDEMSRDFLGWRVDLLASDVSQAALATAAAGRYSQFEVQRGLSTPLLLRHFRQDSGGWCINEHLRGAVQFRRINLLSDFSTQGRFDVVLCRNALMYMDVARRRQILSRFARIVPSDGYLVLGATETIVGLSDEFVAQPGYAGLFRRSGADRGKLRLVVNA